MHLNVQRWYGASNITNDVCLICRNLNSYVSNSFSGWSVPHRLPISSSSCAADYSGTSSFGMSGVNAHAIICSVEASASGLVKLRSPVWFASSKCHVEVLQNYHALLQKAKKASKTSVELSCRIDRPELANLRDHQVNGLPILPGAAYLELSAAAAVSLIKISNPTVGVQDVSIVAPFILPDGYESGVEMKLLVDSGAQSLLVESIQSDKSTTHMKASICQILELQSSCQGLIMPKFSLETVRARCVNPSDIAELYTKMAGIGLQYGPTFR